VDSSTVNLADLPERLPRTDTWLRALLERSDDAWVLRYAYAVVGPCPRTWPGHAWTYDSAVFLAEVVSTTDLVSALSSSDSGSLHLGGYEVSVPVVAARGQVQHRPSFELHDRDRLPQPSFDFVFNRSGQAETFNQQGFLVGPDGPSFTDVDSAYRAFFEGAYDTSGRTSLPGELLRIRAVDSRAWLGPIHVSPTSLTVVLHGSDLAGTILEFFSPSRRDAQTVADEGAIEFALPDGLSASNAWLWLKRDTTWLDYRSLTGPWATEEQLQAAGVNVERPSADQQAIIEAIVYGGEGPAVEFKGSLPDPKSKSPNPWKTIAAFATGAGGVLVFGIDRDELTVLGLGGADMRTERDHLGQMIRARVVPTPDFEITPHVVAGKDVLVLEIQSGASPPYAVIVDGDSRDKPQFYVRRGASTYPAQPSDLSEAVRRIVASSALNPQGLPNQPW
jgi:hypothetical protein